MAVNERGVGLLWPTVILLLAALLFISSLATAGSSPPIVPSGTRGDTLVQTLTATADPAVAYTNEIVTIRFYSEVVQFNESGNASLVPSNHLVNITVLDVPNNVVVERGAVPLFLGRGEFKFPVEALWTSTRLNVSVVDYASGLWGYAEVRTHMSDPYLLWRQEVTLKETLVGPVRQLLIENAAQRDYNAWLTAGITAVFVALFAVVFLRLDHERAREAFQESYADRLRYWLFRWDPKDTWLEDYYDPEKSWDPRAARRWGVHQVQMQLRLLRKERDGLQQEIDALEEAMRSPTTISDAQDKGAMA